MRARIAIGTVRVDVDGLDLSLRDVRRLITLVAGIAAAFDEQSPAPVLGFTAPVLERLPDDLAGE